MPSAKTNAATRNRRKAYVLDKIVEFVDDDRAYVDEINIGDGRKVRLCRNEVTNAVEILVMEGATP